MRILKKYGWALALLLVIPLLGVGGVFVWATNALGSMPEALAALESDEVVTVATEPWLTFSPTAVEATTGFIFYPGGRVDYRSYAPQAREIAAAGYLVVIPEMPLNFAVFSPDMANDVLAAYPDIKQWAIGGHSLGGAMAAKYVYDNPAAVDGLAFWAAYPAESNSLTGAELPITSIWGSVDGVATPDDIAASEPFLPVGTMWVEIVGGNHAQFGWYGDQEGDNPAGISREEQQGQTVAATVALLEVMNGR